MALSFALSIYWFTSFYSAETGRKWALLSIFASILSHVALSCLFILESRRRLPPSDFTTLYLSTSVLCDLVYLVMPLRAPVKKSYVHPVFVRCCTQIILLALECRGTAGAFTTRNKPQAAEDEHNILHRLFLTWINPILWKGYTNILGHEDLPPLSADMHAERTRERMLQAWRQQGMTD